MVNVLFTYKDWIISHKIITKQSCFEIFENEMK